MQIGINPLVDCVFKRLFASEHNKSLLIDIVNALLEKGREPKIVDVEIVDPYNPKQFIGDKITIVDIRARTETGEWIIVEVQVKMTGSFPKRLLYYWARAYQAQLKESERYSRLQKVTLICVSQNALPINTRRYWNHFRVLEQDDQICLCPDLSIYTIELEHFGQTEHQLTDSLEKWSYLLKHGEQLDDSRLPESLQTPPICQAVKEMKMFTQDEIERELYESRRKALMDHASLLHDHYEEGREEGIEIGEQRAKCAMIKQLLATQSLPKEKIADISGWTIAQIDALAEEL